MSGKVFPRKGAKALSLRHLKVFLCAFAPLREKTSMENS
jgi:hypothetical protein